MLFVAGGGSPTGGCLLHGATLERLYDCVLACRVVFARARSFVCDHVRARRGHVVAVAVPWRGRRALDVVTSLDMAVVTWPWRPWVWPWRGAAVAVASAVFVSPSCGCDTPTNASVCNGFGMVCIGSICTTYVGRA